MTIDGGSGEYTHVHGSGLDFSGTIEESDRDAITVRVSGRVSD
jgi:sporulation-control protein spo0M